MIGAFLSYYWRAKTKRKIKDPFVRELIEEVINDDRQFYHFQWLEILRNNLRQNQTMLEVKDLGAGSRKNNAPQRSIASIAKTAVSPKWQTQFLFRLIYFLQPKTKLELGTSLGISTLYQHFANPSASMYTLEGSSAILASAKEIFKQMNVNTIHTVLGNFDKTLPPTLKKIQKLDYAFIDGNHKKEATLNYFEQCLEYAHEDTVLVFDDIHWSKDMEAAWKTITQHPKVNLSIDLFFAGLVFFKPMKKTNLTLIPSSYKFNF